MITRTLVMVGTPTLRHERGAVLVMTTIMLAILLGVAALAIDVGYMYAHRENLRNATDSAAIAAGLAVKENPSVNQNTLDSIALSEAQNIISDLVATDIEVTRSPGTADGYAYDYTGDSTAVGVTITQNKNTFFSRILSIADMDVRTRAVANTGFGAPGLIYVFKKTGEGIRLSGNSTLTVNGGVIVNSTGPNPISISGNFSFIAAEEIGVAANNFICDPPKCRPSAISNMPPGADPLASIPPPTYGACTRTSSYQLTTGQTTINPGVYCGGITISGNNTRVNFSPGTYIIMNGLNISNRATVTGSNVMIYNTGNATYPYRAFTVSQQNTSVNLTGISGGTYNGIVYFQDRNNPRTVSFTSNASVALNGIIYVNKAPGASWSYDNGDLAIDFHSGSATTSDGYTLLVVWSIEFGGGPNYTMYSSFTGGQSPLKHVSLVE